MVTLNKVFRSIGKAKRASERASRKRQRELEQQHKQMARMEELERAAYEVELYENYIDRLISVHKEAGESVNWEAVTNSKPPEKPIPQSLNESKARELWSNYKPGIWDRMWKKEEKSRETLFENIEKGKQRDEEEYQKLLSEYDQSYADWKASKEFADKIMAGEKDAYLEALKELNPFTEISELGSSIDFGISNNKVLTALVHVHGEKVIPKNIKSLLSSGKMSVKAMPKIKYFELYQDHVCSSVVRVARELLAILPVDSAVIHAEDKLLNPQTGHLEDKIILSVAIPRSTLEQINFDTIDPSDSMRNFVHRMNFKKNSGFMEVEPIDPAEINPA